VPLVLQDCFFGDEPLAAPSSRVVVTSSPCRQPWFLPETRTWQLSPDQQVMAPSSCLGCRLISLVIFTREQTAPAAAGQDGTRSPFAYPL
jgi:hypothetical protein